MSDFTARVRATYRFWNHVAAFQRRGWSPVRVNLHWHDEDGDYANSVFGDAKNGCLEAKMGMCREHAK